MASTGAFINQHLLTRSPSYHACQQICPTTNQVLLSSIVFDYYYQLISLRINLDLCWANSGEEQLL